MSPFDDEDTVMTLDALQEALATAAPHKLASDPEVALALYALRAEAALTVFLATGFAAFFAGFAGFLAAGFAAFLAGFATFLAAGFAAFFAGFAFAFLLSFLPILHFT